MQVIPGVDLNEIVDGKTINEHWKYYTINVKYLGSMTHEQFVQEFPNAYKKIEHASRMLDKMKALLEEKDGK